MGERAREEAGGETAKGKKKNLCPASVLAVVIADDGDDDGVAMEVKTKNFAALNKTKHPFFCFCEPLTVPGVS